MLPIGHPLMPPAGLKQGCRPAGCDYPSSMNPLEHDERECAENATAAISHPDVDEAAGDEGIDDAQPDDTGAAPA